MPTFATITAAITYIEGFAARLPDARDALPLRERQAARLPQMQALLARLGDPQEGLRVAHVTGTSGKGSTATMLAAILHAGGQHVGLYTNPYVIAPQERIQIAGSFIADAEFIACAEIVRAAVERWQGEYPNQQVHLKQVWVALALTAFARAGVDTAVIEVGMGGRYDETNVVHPAVAIITSIGYDHMDFLGASLAEIAWHKAGIIKDGAPVITAVTDPDPLSIITDEAARTGSPVEVLGRDFTAHCFVAAADGSRFHYHDADGSLRALHVPLLGAHQVRNAAVAVRAARHLLPTLPAPTVTVGLAAARLPGRFEIVASTPTVVLDVAHNPDKIGALVQTLAATLAWQRLWVIFGALSKKEAAPMLAALAPLQPHLIVTAPTVLGRETQPPTHLAQVARTQGITEVQVADSPQHAVALAQAHADATDVIVVTGSLFLVSNVRPHWVAAAHTASANLP